MFGSGTHGLQRRTRWPPPTLVATDAVSDGPGKSSWSADPGEVGSCGGWAMNWLGMVMRWGEQELQTTLPHFLEHESVSSHLTQQHIQQRGVKRHRNWRHFDNIPAMMLADKEAYETLLVDNDDQGREGLY